MRRHSGALRPCAGEASLSTEALHCATEAPCFRPPWVRLRRYIASYCFFQKESKTPRESTHRETRPERRMWGHAGQEARRGSSIGPVSDLSVSLKLWLGQCLFLNDHAMASSNFVLFLA